MNFDDMNDAVTEAEQTLKCADALTYRLARMLVGRLKKLGNNYVCGELKKELKDFNAKTGVWMR